MPPGQGAHLTERQRAVLERLDRRVPIKMIAAELGISDSRVNQHIRALKDHYAVGSLAELIERSRGSDHAPSIKPAYTNAQLSTSSEPLHQENRVAPEGSFLDRSETYAIKAPYDRRSEPQVVSKVLNGENAVLFRLAVIIGMALGIIAAVLLVMTAALTVSEATAGLAFELTDNKPEQR